MGFLIFTGSYRTPEGRQAFVDVLVPDDERDKKTLSRKLLSEAMDDALAKGKHRYTFDRQPLKTAPEGPFEYSDQCKETQKTVVQFASLSSKRPASKEVPLLESAADFWKQSKKWDSH